MVGGKDCLGIIIGRPLDLGVIGAAADIDKIERLPLIQAIFDLLGRQTGHLRFGCWCCHDFSLLVAPPRLGMSLSATCYDIENGEELLYPEIIMRLSPIIIGWHQNFEMSKWEKTTWE